MIVDTNKLCWLILALMMLIVIQSHRAARKQELQRWSFSHIVCPSAVKRFGLVEADTCVTEDCCSKGTCTFFLYPTQTAMMKIKWSVGMFWNVYESICGKFECSYFLVDSTFWHLQKDLNLNSMSQAWRSQYWDSWLCSGVLVVVWQMWII